MMSLLTDVKIGGDCQSGEANITLRCKSEAAQLPKRRLHYLGNSAFHG